MWSKDFGTAEISFVIISEDSQFVKQKSKVFFWKFWKYFMRGGFVSIWKRLPIFFLGGWAYVLLELLWRGRSHGSMFLAGGTCLLLIGHLDEVSPKLPLPFRILSGAGIITMVELATGLLVNRDYHVWDYRDQPGNFLGQICPVFTLLWVPMAWAAILVYNWLKEKL